MGPTGVVPRKIALKLNGGPLSEGQAGKDVARSKVNVTDHALYELVDQKTPGEGLLEITAEGDGVEMYAFTFGE